MVPEFGFIFLAVAFRGEAGGLQEAGQLHKGGLLLLGVVEFNELVEHDRWAA